MGITRQVLKVKEYRKAAEATEVSFMVDSGAIYSLVPADILNNLGIESHRDVIFALADGSQISRKVGDAYFELNGEEAAPVIFGEKNDEPLLGATTLEALGLVLNPFTRTLHPMRMLLG